MSSTASRIALSVVTGSAVVLGTALMLTLNVATAATLERLDGMNRIEQTTQVQQFDGMNRLATTTASAQRFDGMNRIAQTNMIPTQRFDGMNRISQSATQLASVK